MTYYIKISGIDDNQNISKYIKINDSYDDDIIKPSGDFIIYKQEESKQIKEKEIKQEEIKNKKIKEKEIKEKETKEKEIKEKEIKEKEIKEKEIKEKEIEQEEIKDANVNLNKFNKEQLELLEYVKDNIDSKSIITISGIAGSGKSFTILEMFKEIKDKIKNKSICFSSPTNSVLSRNIQYKEVLSKLFKSVDFLTVSKLLDEKLKYNLKGEPYFKIEKKKKLKIYNYDIIIIDEVSMISDTHLDYIKKYNKSLCILVGDKNQLNPVKCKELDIFADNKINLTQNMRCNNTNINHIYEFLLKQISMYNPSKFSFNTFIKELYTLLYKYNDNKSIYLCSQASDFVKLYSNLSKENESIIGTYTNKECCKLNQLVKNTICSNNNIDLIDKYYVGQQITFVKRHEDWNVSDFAKIKSIQKTQFKFTKVNLNTLVQLNKSYKTTHILTINPNHDYVNEYEKDTKLGYSQNLFNYIVGGTGTIKEIRNIFSILNKYPKCNINKIKLHDNSKISVLHTDFVETYDEYLKINKELINSLCKIKICSKYKKLFDEYIIEGLWTLYNKYRKDIFAYIEDGFACTVHKLQGSSIQNMFVDLRDLFNLTDDNKNKLKAIYTAFTRTISKLVIRISFEPICKCGSFVKEKYSENQYYWLCKNKCGFYESKTLENPNCSSCNNCSKIFYNDYINQYNLCFNCCKEI